MSNLKERLDNLKMEIQKPEFLEGKGLSNEVNIRIFCYDPSEEMVVRHFLGQIMVDQSLNCHLIEHNLYKTFLDICDEKRITKGAPAMEEKKGKDYLIQQIQRFANNKTFSSNKNSSPVSKYSTNLSFIILSLIIQPPIYLYNIILL